MSLFCDIRLVSPSHAKQPSDATLISHGRESRGKPLGLVQGGSACADARQDFARSPEAERSGAGAGWQRLPGVQRAAPLPRVQRWNRWPSDVLKAKRSPKGIRHIVLGITCRNNRGLSKFVVDGKKRNVPSARTRKGGENRGNRKATALPPQWSFREKRGYNSKHNDREFNLEHADNIDATRTNQNRYWDYQNCLHTHEENQI